MAVDATDNTREIKAEQVVLKILKINTFQRFQASNKVKKMPLKPLQIKGFKLRNE